MTNFIKNKGFKLVLLGVALISVVSTLAMSSTSKLPVSAAEETSPFWSTEEHSTLFMVDGYGDLYISLLRKGEPGDTSGAWGFCMNKNKMFPRTDNVLYTSNAYGDWSYVLDSGATPTESQIATAQKILYSYDFVFGKRLTEFGLAADAMGELYHATQIAIWGAMEGWTPADVKYQPEVLENPELLAAAEKIHALYTAIYNYSIDPSTDSFVEGVKLVKYEDGSNVLSTYTLGDKDIVVYPEGAYYRSEAIYLTPNQKLGRITEGDYAFKFTVSLPDGDTTGARIVDYNGNPKTEFSLKEGDSNVFYVEVPMTTVLTTSNSLTVNVKTTQYRRLSPLIWTPNQTAYQAIGMTGYVADSGNAAYTVSWQAETIETALGEVIVKKEGEQPSGFTKATTEYGEISSFNYEQLPLEGTKFIVKIYSAVDAKTIKATDGKTYISGQTIQANIVRYSNKDGLVYFQGLPMDSQNNETVYEVTEVQQSPGFTLGAETVKRTTLTKVVNGVATATVEYVNDRVKYTGSFTKLESYLEDAETLKTATKPVEGVIFGVYNVNEIAGLEKDSLIGTVTSDLNGKVSIDLLDLPSNEQFYLKELETLEHLVLSEEKIYFNTGVESGYNEATKTVTFTNEKSEVVETLVNYPALGSISILKNTEKFNQETKKFELSSATPEELQVIEFAVYSDKECTNKLFDLNKANLVEHEFVLNDLFPGTYYIKETKTTEYLELKDTVYEVAVKANENYELVVENKLKTTAIKIHKIDATEEENKKPLENVTFNLFIEDALILTKTTDAQGTLVFDGVKVGQVYSITEIVPVGYKANSTTHTVDLTKEGFETEKELVIENFLDERKISIVVTKKDSLSMERLEGVEFALYSEADTEFAHPISSGTTNNNGEVVFDNLAPAKYIVKETKELTNYIKSENTHEVDASEAIDKQVFTVEVLNEKYTASIKILKTDATTKSPLEGAKFALYKKGETTPVSEKITNANGELMFSNVAYGEYEVKETAAPADYELDPTAYVVNVTDKTKEQYELNITNSKITATLKIVKADNDNKDKLLANATFKLYLLSDTTYANALATVTTDAKGEAYIAAIPRGQYVLIETESPAGYKEARRDTVVDMTKAEQGDTYIVSIYNIKITEPEIVPEVPIVVIEKPDSGVSGMGIEFLLASSAMILSGLFIILFGAIAYKNND